MRKSIKQITLLLCLSGLLSGALIAQTETSKYKIEDVRNASQSDFDKLKEGEKHKWTNADGNTYGIKNENGKKATFIQVGGKMVRHGSLYLYDKTYGEPRIEYLKEKTNYVYGEKHGLSEIYSLSKNTPYLNESINYSYGLKNGEYTKYSSNGETEKTGEYSNGIEYGVWIHYYTSGSIMYEYNYERYTATRDSYDMISKPKETDEKGRLTATTPYQYFLEDGRGQWKKHGVANIVKYDGSKEEKFYYKGQEVDHRQYNIVNKTAKNLVYVDCAKEASEIRTLIKTIKSTNEQTRTIERIGEEICVYLEKYTPEESESTIIMEGLEATRKLFIELKTRKGNNEDVRRMLIIREKTVITGVRG